MKKLRMRYPDYYRAYLDWYCGPSNFGSRPADDPNHRLKVEHFKAGFEAGRKRRAKGKKNG
jgi:hypothetical protein